MGMHDISDYWLSQIMKVDGANNLKTNCFCWQGQQLQEEEEEEEEEKSI